MLLKVIHVQSVSDLITNSSSEVFIVNHNNPDSDSLCDTIRTVCEKLCEAAGIDSGETLYVSVADKDYSDKFYGYSYKKEIF